MPDLTSSAIASLVFEASTAGTLYVLFGYPVILAFWGRRFARPLFKKPSERSVTVVIPVKNGAHWIQRKLESILDSNYPRHLIEILVVSDGSADATEDLVRAWESRGVRLIVLPSGGKAVAVSRGLQEAVSEIIVLTDVRQEFDREAIRHLVACFADEHVGVVTGELIIREGITSEEYNTGLYWKYEKWIRRNLNRIDAMLGATGSIYAIRQNLRCAIPQDILLDDVYLPFKIAERGYRIYFEDQAKAYDYPTSLHSEFWRKVRTQAGIYQIARYFPALLWPGNRRFLHFLSHKIGRLLLPFFLIAIAASSFWLPEPAKILVLSGQAVFYFVSLVDPLIPERTLLKRVSAPCRTFLTLVAAALCAIAVFFRPSRQLWKETKVRVSTGSASSE